MKKEWLLGMGLSLTLMLAGCGENTNTAGSSDTDGSKSKVEEVEEKPATALAEIAKSVGVAWKEYEDSEYTNVHAAAIYENKGDVPVEIKETQMNHKGVDGSILGTSSMIYSVPDIIAPGETAFIVELAYLEGISPEEYEETTYNFSFDETNDNANLMEISGVKGIPTLDAYKVTGVVKNITDVQQDDIRIAAALLDAEGNLLAVLGSSVDVGVAPNGEAGFELSYPDVPPNIQDKVVTIDVKSYGWNW